ncbi:MAG TPA: bifunctional 4-hydroxy-2-oxoglutarate aldolase/2-dehydro-3-deoxy-phosphogluconate aldolase [Bacteroidota bacterium]|nr:bifunctional 4-hydroxy-2-oxoglutarate aldolase/2-dehydro-3-deoxy-phosphogluconate aldolase [Bacteroidota bacterium]
MSRTRTVNEIKKRAAVAVIRMTDSKKLLRVVEAIGKGGVSVVEITMTVPNAIAMIREAVASVGNDAIVGVGSVLDERTAQSAIDAGAQFVVGPVLKREIIEAAHKQDIPAIPGCFSPTEIQTAFEAGVDIIKVFPADVVGMAFFKAVLAPMPHLSLMPTGGVSLTNAGEWLLAGACAVGVGTALLEKKAIESGDYSRLTENARALCASIAEARARQKQGSR